MHDNKFRNGFSLPLPQCVQYLLSMLQLAPEHIPPNQWRQILSHCCLYYLSDMEWPTINEFRALYRLSYSKKQNCGGCVSFTARDFLSLVTDLPTSINNNWRSKVVLACGIWQRDSQTFVVPNRFRYICDQSYTLSDIKRQWIAQIFVAWPNEEDHIS